MITSKWFRFIIAKIYNVLRYVINCSYTIHVRHMCNLHIKETEISQKRSKEIKNWKITYSVILSVLSNKTNFISGFSSLWNNEWDVNSYTLQMLASRLLFSSTRVLRIVILSVSTSIFSLYGPRTIMTTMTTFHTSVYIFIYPFILLADLLQIYDISQIIIRQIDFPPAPPAATFLLFYVQFRLTLPLTSIFIS